MPKKEDLKVNAYDRLFAGFAGGSSNLACYLFGTERDAGSGLTVTRRGELEWLATLRIYSRADGEWQCFFGSGVGFIEALLELNKSVQKGHARKDKYKDGPPPDWLKGPVVTPPEAGGDGKQGRLFP